MAAFVLRSAGLLRSSANRLSNNARAMSTTMADSGNFTTILNHQTPEFSGVQVTTTANGVTVVSESDGTPSSKISVVVAAGSRNEGVENAGVSHVLRELAFQSTTDRSALAIERHIGSIGAKVTSANDREVISYSATFLKKDIDKVMDNLSSATVNQAFKTWEVEDQKAHLDKYLANMPSKPVVLDALHAGAFRSTLANSSTVAPYNLHGIDTNTVSEYYNDYFTAGNMTVVGAGVDHDELVALVEEKFGHVESKDVTAETANYYGGYESRVASGNGDAEVAVAYQGVARGSDDQVASFVLQEIVSGTGKVKYGTSKNVEAINYNYNDSGLFGVYITSAGSNAGESVREAVTSLKDALSGNFTEQDVTTAKNQIMVKYMDMSASERADFYASQVLATKQPVTPEEFAEQVEAVTIQDVQALATAIAKSKPVVSSAGNVSYVPYASELGL